MDTATKIEGFHDVPPRIMHRLVLASRVYQQMLKLLINFLLFVKRDSFYSGYHLQGFRSVSFQMRKRVCSETTTDASGYSRAGLWRGTQLSLQLTQRIQFP